ncbi:MAG TPA: OmpH family outer membrane protein [Candidatus Gastranaerophilales bacterium]|nr:OmpH family outer membrane protein [Candidatus Gastranaerophilales bacterium]
MNKTKIFIIAVMLFVLLLGFKSLTRAEAKIALVDLNQIAQNYDKAKEAQNDLKAKQEELKKMIAAAKDEVQDIKEEKAKKEREKKLAQEIIEKNKIYGDAFSKEWGEVQNNILLSIKKVADSKDFDLVIEKQSVIAGGEDITKEVLSELKKK